MPETTNPTSAQEAGVRIRRMLLAYTDPNGGKFFENASELASLIATQPEGYYWGKEKSVAGLLSLVFSGDRSCPKHLATALVDVVATRLQGVEPLVKQETLALLQAALADLQEYRDQQAATVVGISRKMAEAMATASNRFVISPLLSDMRRTPMSRHTISVLVKNLQMRSTPLEPYFRYTMCFPHETDCVTFWREVFTELTDPTEEPMEGLPLTRQAAAAGLEFLDGNDFLRVFLLPYHLCLTPTVLYRPERDDCIGFSVFYSESGRLISTEIPSRYLQNWRRFYSDFLRGKVDQERKLFTEYREIFLKGF